MSEVISVRFRNGSKTYYFDPCEYHVRVGQEVIVETAQGLEFATCTQGNHEVPESSVVKPLSAVVRMATDSDRRTVEYHKRREKEAFGIGERKIAEHGLEMKLVGVSASFDGNKLIFYFTADGRVDFRALVRDLASVFRSRIELRQIGVRDEARMVGGIGICGRPFCCAQFLTNFLPVSIKMAKTQNLSLNPTKISGACGRLMCCLKYEQYAYEEAARRLPKAESFVQTPDGPGNVKSVDLLREIVKVALDTDPDHPKSYHSSEIVLLRNGKGSREGIEVPERPARRVEEKRDEFFTPDFFPDPFGAEERNRERVASVPMPAGLDTGNRNARSRDNRRNKSGKPADNAKSAGAVRQSQPSGRQQGPKQKREYYDGGGDKRRNQKRPPWYRNNRRNNNGGDKRGGPGQ